MRYKTIKTGEKPHDIGLGNDFSYMTQKGPKTKAKHKQDYKIENLCHQRTQ